jgi:membrane-bound ClpP family serine protease
VVLLVIGVILVVLGILRHLTAFMLAGIAHLSLALIIIGAIVFIAGAFLGRQSRQAGL